MCLKSNNGGKYGSAQFTNYCAENGIKMMKIFPETLQ